MPLWSQHKGQIKSLFVFGRKYLLQKARQISNKKPLICWFWHLKVQVNLNNEGIPQFTDIQPKAHLISG